MTWYALPRRSLALTAMALVALTAMALVAVTATAFVAATAKTSLASSAKAPLAPNVTASLANHPFAAADAWALSPSAGRPLAGLPVAACRPAAGPAPGPAGVARYRWPLTGTPPVVRAFEPPPRPWLPGHRGVDLGAAPGEVVCAAGGGIVYFAGTVAGRGVVSVLHDNGLRTTYEPVTPLVRAGAQVSPGHPIGLLSAGHAGCRATACLHWGLRDDTSYLDPLALLGLARLRLLPLNGR